MPITTDSNSGEGLIYRPNEQCAEDCSEWSTAGPLTVRFLSMGGIGQLHQQVSIGTLPDDVLLKIFKFFVDATYCYHYATEDWRTLVQVCRRWRDLAFTSPRHLNLQLLCRPPRRLVKEMLDIWPELPIYVHDCECPTKEARDNVVAALRLNHRVSGVHLQKSSDSEWETLVPLMQHSFPVLTHLWVKLRVSITNPISRAFLGGSAPSLRDLQLFGVPFPALPELLLSTTNLVCLWHNNIPRSGYISPQAMVTGLSALTQLESLSMSFQSPQSLPDREIRIPPPHTRILLPSLTYLHFRTVPAYMEDLVTQIDAPLLESVQITLFNQEFLEVSELAKFVHRADKLSLPHQAEVTFRSDSISITLSPELLLRSFNPNTVMLNLACAGSALRLSYLAQFCASCLPTLSPFESLHIHVSMYHMWQDVIDDPDPQWLELLRLFNTVKDLRLSKTVAPHVAQALRMLLVERVMEVLPALENVFISRLEPSGPVQEAISEFADARQRSGHPVSVHDWEGEVYYTKVRRWIDG